MRVEKDENEGKRGVAMVGEKQRGLRRLRIEWRATVKSEDTDGAWAHLMSDTGARFLADRGRKECLD